MKTGYGFLTIYQYTYMLITYICYRSELFARTTYTHVIYRRYQEIKYV